MNYGGSIILLICLKWIFLCLNGILKHYFHDFEFSRISEFFSKNLLKFGAYLIVGLYYNTHSLHRKITFTALPCKLDIFVIFWKFHKFFILSANLTLKMTSKVKSEGWFLLIGYMFGVVYYSMSWPKTNISLRNCGCGHFLLCHKYAKFNNSRTIKPMDLIFLSTLDRTIGHVFAS